MSEEVIVEDAVTAEAAAVIDPAMEKIISQINLGAAIRNYLRVSEEFARASSDFTKCCDELRSCLSPNDKFVFRHNYGQHYLIQSDSENTFSVAPVDSVS